MNTLIRIYISVLIAIIFFSKSYSKINISNQISSTQHPVPNTQLKDTTKTYPGKKPAILSAILPGLGQVYNKKYWKIPIIYALGATTVYFTASNHDKYVFYRDAFICKNDTTCDESFLFTIDQLKVLKDAYRRDRDFFIILTVAVYALNIIDASVDAHLLNFDISDDLSLSVQPGIYQNYYSGISIGLCLNLNFKVNKLGNDKY